MATAAYNEMCPGCGDPIDEGDRIGLVDAEWCCEDCVRRNGGEDPCPPQRDTRTGWQKQQGRA